MLSLGDFRVREKFRSGRFSREIAKLYSIIWNISLKMCGRSCCCKLICLPSLREDVFVSWFCYVLIGQDCVGLIRKMFIVLVLWIWNSLILISNKKMNYFPINHKFIIYYLLVISCVKIWLILLLVVNYINVKNIYI